MKDLNRLKALTPGVVYLAQKAFLFFLTAIGVRVVQQLVLGRFLAVGSFSLAQTLYWTIIFRVFYVIFQVKFRELWNKWDAASKGARMLPVVKGRRIGNLDIMKKVGDMLEKGYPGDFLDEIEADLGRIFNTRGLWEDLIFTSSPDYIKRILATEFDNFVKGERFQEIMYSVLGVGVFNADGEMWKFHRRLTRPFFTREKITHFELFDRYAELAIQKMKNRLLAGHSVDFQDLMGRFTFDASTDFLFGSCADTLQDDLPYAYSHLVNQSTTTTQTRSSRFLEAFVDAQFLVANRGNLSSYWPLLEIFKDKTAQPMQVVRDFLDPIVAKALSRNREQSLENTVKDPQKSKEANDIQVGDNDTLLDYLVKVTNDPIVIRDEILNMMIAGRDTTAGTLTFIMHFLCLYPDVCSRLREEVLHKVGASRRPAVEDVREMKYLRAVINETLRLYPVVPYDVRASIKATVWPSDDPTQPPLYIPSNAPIIYSVFMMHRRKDLWGPDGNDSVETEEFDPERWLDERVRKYLTPNPFIFLPFNAGPRICLGQQFAYNEMSFMIIRLLQSFNSFALDTDPNVLPPNSPDRRPKEWEQCPGRKGIDRFYPKKTLTLYAAGGLWIKGSDSEILNAQDT
ncbi:hypothetical protein D9757_009164 [Collybiopsis confluens]|uniref:Cytochrome P450 n=1 Tax=Collybiopsis confluens TaxID=2823264 RepID=A0A8H5M2C6_9AGAR|nr:hypothetical protein D9757_009164 [Collybiopsis confluens]